ncbi:PAS domain-containing sensor histidine kinase [Kaistella daneshvariae]|uniref:histidine kinase n=1 Tax=Kaistella daneshvariae TaxID=2487074 RepID=A0ABN5T350_9FLAO|nr:PAS domain-containing sensor histidine kinase [Kaistella daneshvariae]AZI67845.1 PAS domain-containing sensor histidine kinase [Kaistella daneshvariae]
MFVLMKNFLNGTISPESIISLFSQAPVGLALLMGEDFVIENANTQILQFWQKDSQVIGLPILEALPEIADQEFPKILKKVYKTGKTYKGSKTKALLERDGLLHTFYFDFIFAPIFSEGVITGTSVVAIDVTEAVLSERKLQENELLFKELMEISDHSTALYRGEDLVIEFANDQMIKTWGKTRAVIGKKLEEALPELEGQPFIDILKNIFRTGESYIAKEDPVDLEVDGRLQTFYYSFSYRPLRDASGKVYAVWNSATDVTELVQARIQAQNAVREYRDLAEAMPHIVWTTDLEGKLVYYNNSLTNFLNLKEEDIDSFDFSTVIHPEDLIRFKEVWEKSTKEQKFFEMEFRLYNPEKNDFVWFLNRATPILDEDGNLIRWIGTSTNIDEFKTLSAQKDTFLGIASHELKTPLTSLKLYAQVLERMLRKTGDGKNAEFAKKMDVQIVKLTSLIGDLLDVTKINSGKIYLNEDVFDFEKLVVEVVEDQQMSTAYKIDLHAKPVGMVFADRDRIAQVITNLISNAIKYSPKADSIVVTVTDTENYVELSVQDFGIGMAADKKDKVFEQYYRVSGDEQSTFPGLGLGLYISSQIVERSHGKISVESTLGYGSTFCFSLPKVKS